MYDHSNTQVISTLQSKIDEVLTPLVPKSGKFALLDFPDYSNVGDSAIWLGEIEYFRKAHKLSPAYVCTSNNYSETVLRKALPEGTVFIQGGGNFGDIWPSHQNFRETVLGHFPDRKIVQLPQSIHFSNREALERAAKIINSHPDFTLLVRDKRSYVIAKEFFSCRVELCPDMAFCIGKVEKPVLPSFDLLLLLRTDVEKPGSLDMTNIKLPEKTLLADWLDDTANLYRDVRRSTIMRLIPLLGLDVFNKNRQKCFYYKQLAEERVGRGLKLLSSADCVITNRLHVHILCLLLNKPHIIMDNNYGKISGFVEAWTAGCGIVNSVPDLATALELFHSKKLCSGALQ